MSFETLREPELNARAHRFLVMHYLQSGKTSDELMKQAYERTHLSQGVGGLFDPEDIQDIRARYAAGDTQRFIANDYGVHVRTVWAIVNGETYRHIPEASAAA